jgi:hypothetical protein
VAYRFSTNNDVRFSMGTLDTYTMGPVTAALLIKRNAINAWGGLITISDGGGSTVLADLLEFDNTNHLAFWNGRSSSNDISGSTAGTITDTTGWWVVVVTWGGASSAPRYHWKPLGSGSWTHQSLSDSTGASSLAIATADRIIIGTDPGGSDDFSGDIVWAGIKKSNDADITVEGLDTTSWSTIQAYGFHWLAGFEASGTINDASGGGGNEVSRGGGITLVSDPSGWSWSGGSSPQSVSVTGKGSVAAFGTTTIVPGGITRSVSGRNSAASFGPVTASPGAVAVNVPGLSGGRVLGALTPSPGGTTILVAGRDSAATFGSLAVGGGLAVDVTGLGSAAAFGALTPSPGGTTIPVSGLASAAQLGSLATSGGEAPTFNPAVHGGKHR